MKKLPAICLTVSALVFSFSLSAKTTTWKAGTTYKTDKVAKSFLDPNNWDNGVPEPGDTAVIAGTSNWDDPIYIGHEGGATDTAETFDFGDKGLTLQITAAYTRLLIDFQGSGRIIKTGSGRLGVASNASFTGGTEIREGLFESWGTYKFGTGEIEFVARSSNKPKITSDTWGGLVQNDILFSGDVAGHEVYRLGQAYAFEALTAEHDCTLVQTYGSMTINHEVSAPEKTLTFKIGRTTDKTSNNPGITIKSSVDADLVFERIDGEFVNPITFEGVSSYPDSDLTVGVSECKFTAVAKWGGTNIVLKDYATQLTLQGSANLSPDAHVTIENNAKISLATGVAAAVRTLTVKGQAIAPGYYTQATLPQVITGAGSLAVGMGKRTTWVRGLTGDYQPAATTKGTHFAISDPANWDNGAPQPGDTLVFPDAYSWNTTASVGLPDETFDIGSQGIVFETVSHVRLNAKLTGSGCVTKTGNGTLGFAISSEHTGGTRILAGKFESFASETSFFGAAPIEFVRSASATPQIEVNSWARGIGNKLIFNGDDGAYTLASLGQEFHFGGDIEATHDFTLEAKNGAFYFKGTVSASGKTFTARCHKDANTDIPSLHFEKAVDANVLKTGNRTLYFKGVSTNPESSLTVREGVCEVSATGVWGGTNIVVEATAATFALKANANLSDAATVRIDTSAGAKIDIASGVKVQIAELFVNGQQKPCGTYSAQNLPSVIAGSGRLKVGNAGLILIVR